MSSTAIAPGLPPGYDPSASELIRVEPDASKTQNDRQIWVVPGGECWLPTLVFAACATGATVGNRVWSLELYDQDGFAIADVAGSSFGASISCFSTWGVGLDTSTSTDSNSNVWQKVALPLVVLQPGWQMWTHLRGSFGGDAFPGAFTGGPYALVTRYLGGAAGGGGGTAEPVPPFLLVPGAEAA